MSVVFRLMNIKPSVHEENIQNDNSFPNYLSIDFISDALYGTVIQFYLFV